MAEKVTRPGSLAALLGLGALAAVSWGAVVGLGDLRFRFPQLVALCAVSLAASVAAAFAVGCFGRARRGDLDLDPRVLFVVLAFAALFRLTLLMAPPSLSDDIYRYLWEGRVVLAGHNPFALAPEAPELARLRDEYHGLINHPGMPTIYPPVAQAVFAVSQLISHRPWSVKLLAVLADMALVVALSFVLRARRRDPAQVVLYAWHPLPILEFAGSGHVDVFALSLLIVALLALESGRERWSMVLLTLSGLTKLFAFALMPVFARRIGWARAVLIAVPLTAAAYLPFLGAGRGLLHSTFEYASRWRFNDSLFSIVALLDDSGAVARLLVVVVFVGLCLAVAWRREDPLRATQLLAVAFVLLSPTVHPWYVTWVIPLLCFSPNLGVMWLTGAAILAYEVLGRYAAGGEWVERSWVRAIEYAPCYLLLLATAVRSWWARRLEGREAASEARATER